MNLSMTVDARLVADLTSKITALEAEIEQWKVDFNEELILRRGAEAELAALQAQPVQEPVAITQAKAVATVTVGQSDHGPFTFQETPYGADVFLSGTKQSLFLTPQLEPGDIRALKHRIYKLEGDVIGLEAIIETYEQCRPEWRIEMEAENEVLRAENRQLTARSERDNDAPMQPVQSPPLTDEQIENGYAEAPMQPKVLTSYEIWVTAVRWAEAAMRTGGAG